MATLMYEAGFQRNPNGEIPGVMRAARVLHGEEANHLSALLSNSASICSRRSRNSFVI